MEHGDAFRSALWGSTIKEVEALAETLGVRLPSADNRLVDRKTQDKLWAELSYYGSNDIAFLLRGRRGVDYPEIVRDVCASRKVKRVREYDTKKKCDRAQRGRADEAVVRRHVGAA